MTEPEDPAAGPAATLRPLPNKHTAFFWEGARARQLLVQRCEDCGRYQHPPQVACKWCTSLALRPAELSGRGTVYTYTVTMQAFHPSLIERVPYILVVVELAEQEQLKVLSRLVGCGEEEASVGMPVEIAFEDVDAELTLPVFRPAAAPRG